MKTIRIGGGCGFLGDSSVAPPQLIAAGIDYLALDYLAEGTMSVLGNLRRRDPDAGFARDFTDWVWRDNLRALKETGTKIVTNAGGVNPRACVARMEELAAREGLTFRIAIVEGDELIDRIDEIARDTEMFTGAPFPPHDQIASANAYLGGMPIARALAMGADVVITGRCVDSALTLGPCIHEFGWGAGDLDQLAQASLAGHVIECGAQGSGGLFTDWEEVEDWAHIGYPIAEVSADGTFVITKPEGTGGLVTPAVVMEQILYEVGDPQAYMLPDVVCDFAHVRVDSVGEHRARVTGAKGYPPTGRYKVSVTHADGHRLIAFMPTVGRDAAKKAQRQAEAVVTRVEEMLRARNIGPFRAKRIEIVGSEASYGAHARAAHTREVIARVAVEHDDPAALKYMVREFDAPITSMAVGSTGWFGARAAPTPVMRLFSTTIAGEAVPATVTLGETSETVAAPSPATPFDMAMIERPDTPRDAAEPAEREVPLIDLAWARSGDKGDAFNIGVIARRPEYLPHIRAALGEDAMKQWFAHEFDGATRPEVRRYELPGMHAINLHFLDALGGGQFASLRLDPLAKAKAQQLLDMPVRVPTALLD